MNYPLVSIITINYDHPEVTCELLATLRKVTYSRVEVIVVDNASPNDDPACIKEQFPEIIFLQSKVNLGFAGGNNLGIHVSKGEYILLLNNDTEVEPGFLEPLVAKLQSNPGIGAVSPKIKFFFLDNTIQFSGQAPINPYTMRSHGYGWGQKDNGQFDKDTPTHFVHGAAMMIPREVLQKVGLMAECYFLYYEELDWGARIRKAGYQLWYVHNSTILHKESISTGKLSPLKIYYMNRSRLLYLRRNVGGLSFLVALLYQLFIAIPKNALVFLFKGNSGHFKAYIRAVGWHLQHLFSREIHWQPEFPMPDSSLQTPGKP
jgi:GT2 family glycosyltransferase